MTRPQSPRQQSIAVLLFLLVSGISLLVFSPGSPSWRMGFNPAAFARLETAPAQAAAFLWPSEQAFRETADLHTDAQPIVLATGEFIRLQGKELLRGLGPFPNWERIQAFLPEVRRLVDIEAENAARKLDEAIRSGADWRTLSRELAPSISLEHCREAVMAFRFDGETWRGQDLLDDGTCSGEFPIQSPEVLFQAGTRPWVNVNPGGLTAFRLTSPTRAYSPTAAAWQAWTYTTTLLTLSRPLYEIAEDGLEAGPENDTTPREEHRAYEERIQAAIQQGGEQGLEAIRGNSPALRSSSRVLGDAADFAEQQGNLDLALQLRSRYRPVGYCSMDTTPQVAARSYADLCYKAGDLPCFLNLQVRIMGDAFERVAYSSYGEAAHTTEAEKLWEIGIDVVRFLHGLSIQYSVPGHARIELPAWRLARSITEAGLGERFAELLSETAQDPAMDLYNRLRAAQTLAYLLFQQHLRSDGPFDQTARKEAWAAILERLEAIALSDEAGLWLDRLRSTVENSD